jgi:hypothetical protein
MVREVSGNIAAPLVKGHRRALPSFLSARPCLGYRSASFQRHRPLYAREYAAHNTGCYAPAVLVSGEVSRARARRRTTAMSTLGRDDKEPTRAKDDRRGRRTKRTKRTKRDLDLPAAQRPGREKLGFTLPGECGRGWRSCARA